MIRKTRCILKWDPRLIDKKTGFTLVLNGQFFVQVSRRKCPT